LLDLEGVIVAGEFDGRMLDYGAKMDISEEMAQRTAQVCAAVSVMSNTLASSFAERSGMRWVPLGVLWRGVFVETSKADFNGLFGALGDERHLEGVYARRA
jgi:roadblock/LC7 domain-containing protein